MERQDLHGFVPAVVTPFTDSGAIDEMAFGRLVDWLIGIGATGICVAGDNGESWALSAEERGRLTGLAVAATARRVPVITGASAPTLSGVLTYARAAAENGAVGLLVMPPNYVLKGTGDEIRRRYGSLADAVDLPIVVYNSPRRAGYTIPLEVLDTLFDVAPIVGIKESDRDFFRLSHLIARFADRMQIMVGPAHFILPGLALGAAGFIATGPELLGGDVGRIVAAARRAPDAEFRRLHHQLVGVYELLMGTGTWPSSFKAALGLIGHPAGTTRDPVLPLDEAEVRGVRAALQDLGLI